MSYPVLSLDQLYHALCPLSHMHHGDRPRCSLHLFVADALQDVHMHFTCGGLSGGLCRPLGSHPRAGEGAEAWVGVEVADVQAELEATKGSVRDQLKEKDVRINELVEDLGNTQAMLSDKRAELEQVTLRTLLTIQARVSSPALTAGCDRILNLY